MIGRSIAHLDLFDRSGSVGIDRDREPERRVVREVTETIEVFALIHGERRVVGVAEVVVLLVPQLVDVHRLTQRARLCAHSAI